MAEPRKKRATKAAGSATPRAKRAAKRAVTELATPAEAVAEPAPPVEAVAEPAIPAEAPASEAQAELTALPSGTDVGAVDAPAEAVASRSREATTIEQLMEVNPFRAKVISLIVQKMK